jgi:alkylhydroperoxidase family enzyme
VFGWLFCKPAARLSGVPEFHVFTMLARHKRLFWSWASFSGILLSRGRLPRSDTELVILRMAHLRGGEYEGQHHRRIALRHGVGCVLAAARRPSEPPRVDRIRHAGGPIRCAGDDAQYIWRSAN